MAATLDSAGALALRRNIYAKPSVTRTDLTNLLALGRAAGSAAPKDYADLLSAVAVDLLVNQADPTKYITQADADWLVAQLGQGGGLSCRAEFEMLVDVLRYAVSVPASLTAFAVGEIETAIINGHKAGAGVADHAVGVITHDDVEALRTTVFAATDGSSLHVTRASAEALFRIAHATNGADNDATFDDFFAKAIGNYLMGIAHRWTPSVADELEREKWLNEKTPSFGAFLGGIFRGLSEKHADADLESKIKAENEADAQDLARAGAVDPDETNWLLAHLTRDGPVTSAEKSLLRFLKQEAPVLQPALTAMMEREAA